MLSDKVEPPRLLGGRRSDLPRPPLPASFREHVRLMRRWLRQVTDPVPGDMYDWSRDGAG